MAGKGWLHRVVLIPSAVFLSALFGGAYGSGREVVEFISRHGPGGGFVAIGTIALVYAVCLFLCFELARLFGNYEYRGFAARLLGPARFLYEILILIGLLLALAICASAGGAIANSHLGLPTMVGGVGVLLIIVTLTFFGRRIVEESMVVAVAALGLVLVYLFVNVLSGFSSDIATAFGAEPLVWDGVGTGLTYALTNCGFLPLLLYCARGLQSRRETFAAAIFAALAGVVPAIAFHISFMTSYPAIVEQPLPAYWLIESIMSPVFLTVYVIVVFVLVAQTGVALMQGMVEAVDKLLLERRGRPLPALGHAAISGGALVAASGLASIGLVALIVRAYGFLSVSFLVVFFLPLFVRGSYWALTMRRPGDRVPI